MRKVFPNIILFILLLFPLLAKADTNRRSTQEMNAIAHSVLSSNGARRIIPLKATLSSSQILSDRPIVDNESFHVFTPVSNNDKGFVIVSADRRMPEVLGYSDETNFDQAQLPDGLLWLLSKYDADAQMISQLSYEQAMALIGTTSSLTRTEAPEVQTVSPLLGKRAWNQGSPFNKLCPKSSAWSNTVTGCVATALAQILANHRYPQIGKGHIYYTTTTDQLSVNVDLGTESPYDWDNMIDTYVTNLYNEDQANAVAQLMFHIGAAVQMDYTASSSGAYDIDALKALVNNFDYDDEVSLIQAGYYSYPEWNSILQAELLAGRPVYYSGSNRSATSGHAFVFDGFDEKGLYHVNWGWSGSGNGYYSLTALTPENVGIGAGAGDYSYYSAAIVGIRPNDSIADPTPTNINASYIYLSNIESGNYPRTQSVGITVPMVINNHFLYFSGDLRPILTDTEGNVIRELGTAKTFTLPSNSYQRRPSTFYMTLPDDLADGEYRLYIGVRQKGKTVWDILRAPREDDFSKYNYYELVIEGDYYSIGTGELPSHIEHSTTLPDRHITFGQSEKTEITACKDLLGYDILSPQGTLLHSERRRINIGESLTFPLKHNKQRILLLRTYGINGECVITKIAIH